MARRWIEKQNLMMTVFFLIATTASLSPCFAQKSSGVGKAPNEATVARGKYLVEGVARCGQCHTPRDAEGNTDRNHTLEGAAVWLKSAELTQDWPLQAPRLAGNPPGTDEEMVKLLTTGIWKDGARLREPMPQFRMSAEDAQAVVAYLKSLSPGAR